MKKIIYWLIGFNPEYWRIELDDLHHWTTILKERCDALAEVLDIEEKWIKQYRKKEVDRVLSWGQQNKEKFIHKLHGPGMKELLKKNYFTELDDYWREYVYSHILSEYSHRRDDYDLNCLKK